MNDLYTEFLNEIDKHLSQTIRPERKLDLNQIGGTAVIMQYGLNRPTKDFDVLINTPAPIWDESTRVFGRDSDYAIQHNFYLETVFTGLPNVPEGFRLRCIEVNGDWTFIRLWRLEVHDLLITKLR